MKASKNIALDIELLQKAEGIAKERQTSISSIINEVLRENL